MNIVYYLLGFIIIWLVFYFTRYRRVNDDEVALIEEMGVFSKVLESRLYFIWPVVQKLIKYPKENVDFFEETVSFIDGENIILVEFWYTIEQVDLYHYGVQDHSRAIKNQLFHHLRPLLKEYNYSTVDIDSNEIMERLSEKVDPNYAAWGIKMNELKIIKI